MAGSQGALLSKKIFICTGEASGEYHGACLAEALAEAAPGIEIRGVGGERMQAAGVRLSAHIDALNVMGIVELLPKLWSVKRLHGRLVREIRTWRPDAVVLIDFPDFNLRLARALRESGIKIIYFIPPKLWAWRAWRVRQIRAWIDRLLVVFPFEVAFYAKHGVKAEFVGNPLLDHCEARKRDYLGGQPVIGVVPGSRRGELRKLLPPMLDAVAELRKRYPGARFLLPAASTVTSDLLAGVAEAGVEVCARPLAEVLAECDYAWVASGTAALEAALVGVPMVVVYRVHPLSLAIAKRLVKLNHFSLPNILANREVVPELLQNDVNGRRLAWEATRLLEDAEERGRMCRGLGEVRASLGEPGAPRRAAAAILGSMPTEVR
jgi:lipid-A-disaccharide synthase